MPYYLDINPSNQNGNQYVTIPAVAISGDFTIEIDCEIYNTTTTGADGFVFSGGTSGGGFEFYRDSPAQNYRPSLWYNNTKNFCSASNIWPYVSGSTANPRTITIQRVGGVVSSNFAGTVGTDVNIASGNNIVISAIGARPNGTFTVGMRLYRLRIYQGATLVRDYNAANTSSGVTLVDDVSGQNGTIQNPPAGNAQWIFYSSGASNYADTLLAGSYAHSGSLLNSSVGYSSALQAGSFAHSGSQLSSSAARSSVLLAGSYTHSGSVLGSAVGYSSTLQSGAFSYSGSELQSIISNGAQNYSDTLLGGSFTHSGSVLQSAAARNSTLLAGSYSHAGSTLSASLAFYSTLNGGAYSHFGSMLQSTISGQVTVSIEGYTITFAADDVSGAFAADTVAATFINDYVSATWSN